MAASRWNRRWILALLVVAAAPAVARATAPQSAPSAPRPVSIVPVTAPLPAIDPSADAWIAPGTGRVVIDDFEATAWPDASVWPLVADLTGTADGDHRWAPSRCHAASGARSLWAIGGGATGAALACGAQYPAALQVAAVLALDLGALRDAGAVDLVFDAWADAAPDEGLFIDYLAFAAGGTVSERRVVYSATGRQTGWSRGVRLDLTTLRDRADPTWTIDLRGRRAYLEFLFVSASASAPGEGVFVDNVALDARERPPIVVTSVPTTATPPSSDRTVGCSTEADCRTLSVSAFVDYRCDRRFRNGVDYYVRSTPRVDVTAGTDRLGTSLSRSGTATFRVRSGAGAKVELSVPDGYETCPYATNPRALAASEFRASGATQVVFGLVRRR